MPKVTTTLNPGDDAASIVVGMLHRLPQGIPVRVEITCDDSSLSIAPGLAEFRAKVAEARSLAPASPWASTEEAIDAIREGEEV